MEIRPFSFFLSFFVLSLARLCQSISLAAREPIWAVQSVTSNENVCKGSKRGRKGDSKNTMSDVRKKERSNEKIRGDPVFAS